MSGEKGWIEQEHLEAICIRAVGQQVWDAVNTIGHFRIREQVLTILNAAKAEGWTPPPGGDAQ